MSPEESMSEDERVIMAIDHIMQSQRIASGEIASMFGKDKREENTPLFAAGFAAGFIAGDDQEGRPIEKAHVMDAMRLLIERYRESDIFDSIIEAGKGEP